nr:Mu-like prophage major head subunit gpT family protein [Cardiobacterium sp. Marseille-Q4385]DAW71809.1 MAG TPA: major capsid protein [Caudoviricetes sp.]
MNKTEILKALTAAFRKEFADGLKHREPSWNKVAMRIPSTTRTNTYGWLGAFPQMREWVGSRLIKKMATQVMAIENKTFETTVSIARADIEDDQVGIYRPVMKQAGVAAAELPDTSSGRYSARARPPFATTGKTFSIPTTSGMQTKTAPARRRR